MSPRRHVTLSREVNASHACRPNTSLGPAGAVLSRTRTRRHEHDATSTQLPLLKLWLDFRHLVMVITSSTETNTTLRLCN